MARPIPREAPVTSATFPFNELFMSLMMSEIANKTIRHSRKKSKCAFLKDFQVRTRMDRMRVRTLHGGCSRKNWLALVALTRTWFRLFVTTGAGLFVLQTTGGVRLVADASTKPSG